VGLAEDALSMYSKLEKVPDAVVNDYLTLLTDLDLAALPENPRERQKAMALAITAARHTFEEALNAQSQAGMIVLGGGAALVARLTTFTPGSRSVIDTVQSVPLSSVEFPVKAFFLLKALGLCPSSSEARRQIQGGGVKLDGQKLTDANQEFLSATELQGKVLQLGKKTFRRLVGG
jgi:tyrosyl-tRNA synthetase